jgi:hypothetical protein
MIAWWHRFVNTCKAAGKGHKLLLYDKAAQELKELYFYTPRHKVTVKGNLVLLSLIAPYCVRR